MNGVKPGMRARNFGSLTPEHVFVNYLQGALLARQNKDFPDFAYRWTKSDYEKWMRQALEGFRRPILISTDISNFDAVQWAWLTRVVDEADWKQYCKQLERHFPWWTKEHTKIVLEIVTNPITECHYAHKGIRVLIIWIIGQTLSGLGPRTTYGNTRRARAVYEFLCSISNVMKKRYIDVGDDLFLIIEP